MSSLRAVVVSEAKLWDMPWHAYCVEFEQVLAEVLDADVVDIVESGGALADRLRHRYRVRNTIARLGGPRPYSWNVGDTEYDLAVIVASDLQQLSVLASLPGWRRIANRFVAYVFEVWPTWLPAAQLLIGDVVERLDHLFVGIESVVPQLEQCTTTPVTFLPPAVDVLAISPVTEVAQKRIDVSNRGRRHPVQHEILLRWAEASGAFYEFDTAAPTAVSNPRDHRAHFYEETARSLAFVANMARFDLPELRGDSHEFGLRYFEALACGTVPVGVHPPVAAQQRVLGSLSGLIDFPVEPAEMPAALVDLLADRPAALELGLANRRLALQYHDVLHRWDDMSAALRIGPTPGTERRRARLDQECSNL